MELHEVGEARQNVLPEEVGEFLHAEHNIQPGDVVEDPDPGQPREDDVVKVLGALPHTGVADVNPSLDVIRN